MYHEVFLEVLFLFFSLGVISSSLLHSKIIVYPFRLGKTYIPKRPRPLKGTPTIQKKKKHETKQ